MSLSPLPVPKPAAATPWTCPFCPLLCDAFSVEENAQGLFLQGSDCGRARDALARFGVKGGVQTPRIDGLPCTLDEAVARAAQLLGGSRQALFGGLGTDVAGARALYRLACCTGAISDAAGGAALMHGLRALQDRGAFTTTLAEVRTRADLIVCIGGSPARLHPEFFRRCGFDENGPGEAWDTSRTRTVVVLDCDGAPASAPRPAAADDGLDGLAGLKGVEVQRLRLEGDLFDAVSMLAAQVAARMPAPASSSPAAPANGLDALARQLHAAQYAVLVWQGTTLPAQGALIVEAIQRIVNTLNRTTRAAALPLGGGEGAATVNQVFAWLSGLPLRSRSGPAGLEHEPVCFDATRLLQAQAVDSLLWIQSFNAEALPPAAAVALPRIVLGPTGMAVPSGDAPTVFIPVCTPGIGADGHLFRTDGVVLMPLHAVRADGLPTVAEVLGRIQQALVVGQAQGRRVARPEGAP